jgi:hypothetical protein
MKTPLKTFNIVWSPEGRTIATVEARDAASAKKQTPAPYKRYMGEVYVELKSVTDANNIEKE